MQFTEIHKKNQERNSFFSQNLNLLRSFLTSLDCPLSLQLTYILALQASEGKNSFKITLQGLANCHFTSDYLKNEGIGLFEKYSDQQIRRKLESVDLWQDNVGIVLLKWIPAGKNSRLELPLIDHLNAIWAILGSPPYALDLPCGTSQKIKETSEEYARLLKMDAIPTPKTKEEKTKEKYEKMIDSLEKDSSKALTKEQIEAKIEFCKNMENRFRYQREKLQKKLLPSNLLQSYSSTASKHSEEDQHGEGSSLLEETAQKEGEKSENTRIYNPIKSDRVPYTGKHLLSNEKIKTYQEKNEEKKTSIFEKNKKPVKNYGNLEAKKQIENFAEMGAEKFDLVYWEKSGKKVWLPEVTKEDILEDLDHAILQKKPVLTPKSSLPIIKLDDANEELLKILSPVAFQVVQTSENKYHVWLGFQDKVDIKEIRYRIVKKLGKPLDLTDSGESTRLAGSKNEKHDGFLVKLKKFTNYLTSESELVERGILEKIEAIPQKSVPLPRAGLLSSKVLPSFAEFEARCPEKEEGKKDISRAIFRWTLRALELGFTKTEILPELEILCGHKKRRNKKVAQKTLENAIKVMSKKGKVIVCQ